MKPDNEVFQTLVNAKVVGSDLVINCLYLGEWYEGSLKAPTNVNLDAVMKVINEEKFQITPVSYKEVKIIINETVHLSLWNCKIR